MMLMVIHHSAVNTLPSTEFLYTRCTDLYSTLAVGPVRLPQAVNAFWELPYRLAH